MATDPTPARPDDQAGSEEILREEEQISTASSLFDLRTVIAVLFGVYGLVLVVMGLFFTSDDDLAKTDGLRINLWTGVSMLVIAGLFWLWLWLRPTMVDPDPDPDPDAAAAAGEDRPAAH